MNSSSLAFHSSAGSAISCPQRPSLQRPELSLHSSTFTQSRSRVTTTVPPTLKKKRQEQQQEGEVKGRLQLFDIYKSVSEMYDAHPCESVCARV